MCLKIYVGVNIYVCVCGREIKLLFIATKHKQIFLIEFYRKQLEKCDLLDKRRKLQKFSGKDEVAIPVKTSDMSILAKHIDQTEHNILLMEIDLPLSKAEMIETPAEKLKRAVNHLLKENGFHDNDTEKLIHEVPDHWEKHGDLILLPCNAFRSASWRCLSKLLYIFEKVNICKILFDHYWSFLYSLASDFILSTIFCLFDYLEYKKSCLEI